MLRAKIGYPDYAAKRPAMTRPSGKACIRTRISRPIREYSQADAYGGYNELSTADRRPGPIYRRPRVELYGRRKFFRKFFELADIRPEAAAGQKKTAAWSPLAT